jgi:Domain of unknown function (DUF5655)
VSESVSNIGETAVTSIAAQCRSHRIYETLLKVGLGVGADAKACPCKTIVPLYREHVFAEIKPATNSRIDLGLALGKVSAKIPARIEPVRNAVATASRTASRSSRSIRSTRSSHDG